MLRFSNWSAANLRSQMSEGEGGGDSSAPLSLQSGYGSSLFGPSRPHRCELRAASLLSDRYTSEYSDMALRRLNRSLTSFLLTSSYYLPLDLSIYPSSPVLAGER